MESQHKNSNCTRPFFPPPQRKTEKNRSGYARLQDWRSDQAATVLGAAGVDPGRDPGFSERGVRKFLRKGSGVQP